MKLDLSKWANTYLEVIRELRGTHFFKVLVLTAFMLFLASLAMYLAEHREGLAEYGFIDSIWWVLVTVTTVGYGDIVPKTLAGRLVGFIIMIVGLFLVSLMTASIASVFVSRKIKEGKGLEDVLDSDHIVICGWNEGGLKLIAGLYHHFQPKVPVVVLVNELPREEVDSILYHFPDITFRYVRGDFTKEEILARANMKRARAAVLLCDHSGGRSEEKADERTVFGALAIRSMAPKIKTCAELVYSENKEHLRRANVDEIVVRGEFNPAILAGAATAGGLSTVMKRLMNVDESNKLWRARIPDRFIGQTASQLSEFFQKKYAALLLAVVTETPAIQLEDILSSDASAIDQFIKRKFEASGKDYFASSKERLTVQINPPPDYVLTRHDAAIVLGRDRPDESSGL